MPAQELTVPTGPIQTSNPTTLEAIANLALAWDAENDIEKRIQDHALRMLLLLIADASSASYDERIAQASSLIDSNLARKWTLEEISSKSGLSPSQFSRLFTKHFGEPPIQNLIHRRMKEAKRLVLETSLSIGEICAAVGYENQSFFERQFLKHVGFDAEALRRNRAI
jgi:AraC-like DNA-binding protein